MDDLTRERAVAFWREVADGVARGDRALLIAEDEQGICGTVQLRYAPAGQPAAPRRRREDAGAPPRPPPRPGRGADGGDRRGGARGGQDAAGARHASRTATPTACTRASAGSGSARSPTTRCTPTAACARRRSSTGGWRRTEAVSPAGGGADALPIRGEREGWLQRVRRIGVRARRSRGARAGGRAARRGPAARRRAGPRARTRGGAPPAASRAPTRQSSSKARRTYASQSITGTTSRSAPSSSTKRPSGKRPAGELAQAVVQAVDGLHGRRRIDVRRVGQRPLGDVDQHAEPVGDVLVERALEGQHHAAPRVVLPQRPLGALHDEQRAAGGDEVAERGLQHEPAVRRRARPRPAARGRGGRRRRSGRRRCAAAAPARRAGRGRGRRDRAGAACPCRRARSASRPAASGRCGGRRARAPRSRRRPARRRRRSPGRARCRRPRTAPRAWRASRGRRWRRTGRWRSGSACRAGSSARCAARTAPWRAGRRPS